MGRFDDWEKKKNFSLSDWKNTTRNIKKCYKFIKDKKGSLIFYIVISILSIPISIITPLLSARILLDLNGELYRDLLLTAAFILVVYTVEHLLRFISRLIYRKYTLDVTYNMQCELMKEIFDLKVVNFDINGTGVFDERLKNDTRGIITIFESIADTLIELSTNIGIIIVVFSVSKIMGIYFVISGLIGLLFEKKRTKFHYERFGRIRSLEDKNTGFLQELIRGIRDVKVLNASDVFMNKFEERVSEVNEQTLSLHVQNSKFNLFSGIIDEIVNFLFFFLGVILVTKNFLTASNFVVLYMYKDKVRFFFGYLEYMIDHIKSFNFSANRVFEIIDGKEFEKEKFGKIKLKKVNGDFEFRNVSFSYNEDREILHDINFKVLANQTVAFVGKTGSGKSTIFSLLNRLYTVDDGHIFIDKNDINTLTKDSIRNNMSIITQNPYIFNLSIRDNLSLVRENVSEEEMIEACKIACLHDFIMKLPNGYDTIVGEGGVTLSGGERQRLAIARALIKNTEIILFDEATSALDNETQEKIQTAIRNLKGKYTILIIAHRLSTVINSDKIIMIEDGKIIGEGSHQELLEKSNEYRNLYEADIIK